MYSNNDEKRSSRPAIPGLRHGPKDLKTQHGAPRNVYNYKPLKPANLENGEIRLLTLLPGRAGSMIECSLQHVHLASTLSYEALSYAWGNPKGPLSIVPVAGDPSKTHIIAVDGCAKEISYNLEAALQKIRGHLEARVIWVDAICIDQANNEEKSAQVKVMAKIYEQAVRTLTWLGEHDQYVDLAFDTLEQICWVTKILIIRYWARMLGLAEREITDEAVMYHIDMKRALARNLERSPFNSMFSPAKTRNFRRALSLVSVDASSSVANLIDFATDKWGKTGFLVVFFLADQGNFSDIPGFQVNLKALSDVFNERSYWKRLWTIQETTLSTEVRIMCGDRQIDLVMMAYIDCITSPVDVEQCTSRTLAVSADTPFKEQLRIGLLSVMYMSDCSTSGHKRSLAQMVEYYSSNLCSDFRDKIYALLSASTDLMIDPDYNQTVADVYTTATKAIIRQEQSLNVLCMAADETVLENSNHASLDELPSWVPHFEGSLTRGQLHNLYTPYEKQLFVAGGPFSLCQHPFCEDDSKVLELHGCVYGEITDTHHSIGRALTYAHGDKTWPLVSKLARNERWTPRSSSSDSDTLADFWRLLLLDTYPCNEILAPQRLLRCAESHNALESDLQQAHTAKPPMRLTDRLFLSLHRKTLCKTTKGNLALALGDVKNGDIVFVARGASMPFILRSTTSKEVRHLGRSKSNPMYYRFVGGSYVHGIMDGEVARLMDSRELEERSVFLI